MPSHGGPYDAVQQLPKQYPRRTERTRKLDYYRDDLDERPSERDQCVDTNIEERMCLCRRPVAGKRRNTEGGVDAEVVVGVTDRRVGV